MQTEINVIYDGEAEQIRRFIQLKNESMRRMDVNELTNGAFVRMMMDVWEHQLQSDAGGIHYHVDTEPDSHGAGNDIVRTSGVTAYGQDA